jgi:hypothetical protein
MNHETGFIYKTGSTTASGGIDTVNYSNPGVFGVPKIMTEWGIDVAMKCGVHASFLHLYKDPVNIVPDRSNQNPEAIYFTNTPVIIY